MRHRVAKSLLKRIEKGETLPQRQLREVCAEMSKYPDEVEAICCQPHNSRFWGADYWVTPELVRHRFGDGGYWGTLSLMNDRPWYYLIMGDSAWSRGDRFRDALDEIYEVIEDQFGSKTFWCEVCNSEWADEENDCCYAERQWPAIDSDGCSWGFPCYDSSPRLAVAR